MMESLVDRKRFGKNILRLFLFSMPVMYLGAILAVSLHEIVGHGITARLLGGIGDFSMISLFYPDRLLRIAVIALCGFLMSAMIVLFNAWYYRIALRLVEEGRPVGRKRKAAVCLMIFLQQALCWFVYDWNQIVPGVGILPSVLGVAVAARRIDRALRTASCHIVDAMRRCDAVHRAVAPERRHFFGIGVYGSRTAKTHRSGMLKFPYGVVMVSQNEYHPSATPSQPKLRWTLKVLLEASIPSITSAWPDPSSPSAVPSM